LIPAIGAVSARGEDADAGMSFYSDKHNQESADADAGMSYYSGK